MANQSLHRILMLTAACAATLIAGPAAADDSQASISNQSFVIGVSDTVTISLWKNPDLNAQVSVLPDGLISLPLVGDVRAAGRRPAELREELERLYQDFLETPEVSLVVDAVNSRKFYILGEVSRSGEFDLLLPTTLMQALARAGGLTDFAKKDSIVLLRQTESGEQYIELSIKAVQKGKDLDHNVQLKPGDTIIVP